jgi:tetratricopeptide (TPR) repeat protein
LSNSRIIRSTHVPVVLFGQLDSREVSLWITDDPDNLSSLPALAALTDLPWRQVISEINSSGFVAALRQQEDLADPMVRLRGLKHVISDNPSDIDLPPRALPIFLLDGLPGDRPTGFAARTRRQNMLTELERARVRTLVLAGLPSRRALEDLSDLWEESFRPTIYVVSPSENAEGSLDLLLEKAGSGAHGVVELSPTVFNKSLVEVYVSQREGSHFLRARDASGQALRLDVTSLDEPERPLLGKFETIFDAALHPLLASDLSPEEVQDFFLDVRTSWRPFAAGMPFHAGSSAIGKVVNVLRRMEREKADLLKVRFISAEDGAGATTLLRSICWEAASQGFPVLIAREIPFEPSADEISSYINRVNALMGEISEAGVTAIHEIPWVIAFDRGVWDGHEDDLVVFARRLETLGRQAAIIVVTGSFLPIPFYSDKRFEKIAELSHIITSAEAESLGTHLNGFLSRIGAEKTVEQWRAFLHETTSHSDGSQASFWVALSFWLQGRFNLQETFDAWVYRQFRENIADGEVVESVLKMSALATERTAMPLALLPPTTDFPVNEKLFDARSQAPALGLILLSSDYGKYWTILHRTVAEALLSGFFYDNEFRRQCGYETADNPTHLAIRILTDIAQDSRLAQSQYQSLAERFATEIFKIDPEHGYSRFTPYWREVLKALEGMPEIFRKTNRAFLHHSAISRRRIASDDATFPLDSADRAELLQTAITKITTALSIPPTGDAEPDINLYNSLARAYYDLANTQIALGEGVDAIRATQRKAAEATFRAYRLNPNNPYVVETYAENLLVDGRSDQALAPKNALEVLTLVYSMLGRDDSYKRKYSLTRLADRAFDMLLSSSSGRGGADPTDPIGAIQIALRPLATFEDRFEGMELVDYPADVRDQVAEGLASPVLQGNPQAVKLRYVLACIDRPEDYDLQLSLLMSLGDVEGIVTPQMLLEKAVLLYQNGRPFEGDQMFGQLRRLWQKRSHFVEVPDRLHWLIEPVTRQRRQVKARVMQRGEFRSIARVEDFSNGTAVFRSREFGDAIGAPGSVFSALVSFGHNGPFLRPLTAR